MSLTRRDLLARAGASAAGAGLLAAWPAEASSGADAALHALFDLLQAERKADPSSAARHARLLAEFPAEGLSPVRALDRQAVLFMLEGEATAAARFPWGVTGGRFTPYVLTHLQGAHVTAPAQLEKQAAIASAAEAEAWLARLRGFAATLDQETVRAREAAGEGRVPPAFILDLTLDRLSSLRTALGEGSPLPGRFGDAATAAGLDGAALSARARRLLADEIAPALARQVELLASQRASSGGNGVGGLRDGDAYYATALATLCTTPITPEEAHTLGLRWAGELTAETDRALRVAGLGDGGVGERLAALATDPRHLYADTAEGRARAVADMNARLGAIRPRLPALFGPLPQGPIDIRRLSDEEERQGVQGWRLNPSFDGTKPGAYYVDLARIRDRPVWSLPTVVDHETVPGHLLQSALQDRAAPHPLRAQLASPGASLEGWSIYAQRLGDEMGLYADDPLGRVGYLQSLLFRTARLVADTGIHAKGWGREKAVDYMVGLTAETRDVVEKEVARAFVLPGHVAAPMVGYDRHVAFRDAAARAAGPRFDLKSFHDAILAPGPLPLAVLERHLTSSRT
ncbi:MAG TPA: DUF885 family protein [Azospirillaceae bacterium]|nr:DUF885 family protein [Azospirillaceae bacterium]